MEISLNLILIDAKTKEIWKTPKHNDDKRKDDFHRDVKPIIIRKLTRKLKNRFGENCDIHISDGEIYIVSQRINEKTGKRENNRINTNLSAEDYFDQISELLFITILNQLNIFDFESIKITIDRNSENIVNFIVELETKEK